MKKQWIFGSIIALLLGFLSFMVFDSAPPYEWDGGEVHPDPAPDGAQISVCWKLRINRICPGTIQRQIIDSRAEVHNYDPVLAAAKEDVSAHFCVTFALPLGLPRGPAKYRVHAAYACNPLQYVWPIRVTTPEITFTLGD